MSWEGDAFVARLTAEGSGLLYGTFLGGYNSEHGKAIAVDDAGRVTVVGSTTSYSFPTTANAFDPSFNDLGDPDAFVARLSMSQISIAASQIDQAAGRIDGNLDDWNQPVSLVLSRDTAAYMVTQPPGGPPPPLADNSAELRSAWTSTDLYFAIYVRDDFVFYDDPTVVWRDDEIELAFVGAWDGIPAGGDTHQYTVNADGRPTDFGDLANPVPIQAAAHRVAGGWNVEVRIPVSHLFGFNASLTTGRTMAFDLGLHDDDDGGNWDSTMIWAGDSTSYHAGGLLRLEDVASRQRRCLPARQHKPRQHRRQLEPPHQWPPRPGRQRPTPTSTPTSTANVNSHCHQNCYQHTHGDTSCAAPLPAAHAAALAAPAGLPAAGPTASSPVALPLIDGDLSDWGQGSIILLNKDTADTVAGQVPPFEDSSAVLRALWTSNDLYFALQVSDDVIVNDSQDIWRDDEIELAFVGAYDGLRAGNDTHQYTLNADGRITDFGTPSPPIQAAVQQVPGGWNVGDPHSRIPPAGGQYDSACHSLDRLLLSVFTTPTLHGASDCYADPHTNRNADKHCHRHGHSDRYGNAFADADIDAGRALSLSAADLAPLDQRMVE